MIEYLLDKGCDAATMKKISNSLADDAKILRSASTYLRDIKLPDMSKAFVLSHALEERVIEKTDLSLLALQTSLHDEGLAVIRAGLLSKDAQQFAHACELLSMLDHESSATLLTLFDETPKSNNDTQLIDKVEDLIQLIQGMADPWLNECVNYFSKSIAEKHV